MNLWLRLLWLFLTARTRSPLSITNGSSVLPMRVLPLDVDMSWHMNNGRYLAVMDLGRIDLLIRTGLWRAVLKNRWTPVANAIAIRFRRELRPLERYTLETRVVGWAESAIYLEQILRSESPDRAGQISAHAVFKGALYDRKTATYVPTDRLMSELGLAIESPPLPPEIETLRAADEALREAGRKLAGGNGNG